MKKIYILAFCLTTLSAAFAQSSYDRQKSYPNTDSRNDGYTYSSPINKTGVYVRDDRTDSRYDHRYNEQYSFNVRERDAAIFRIKQDYANRMNAIQFNRFMRNGEKRRALRSLEEQRDFEIKKVYMRFDDNRNKFNDKYYDRNFNWRH